MNACLNVNNASNTSIAKVFERTANNVDPGGFSRRRSTVDVNIALTLTKTDPFVLK